MKNHSLKVAKRSRRAKSNLSINTSNLMKIKLKTNQERASMNVVQTETEDTMVLHHFLGANTAKNRVVFQANDNNLNKEQIF